jgi:hypothetical protein
MGLLNGFLRVAGLPSLLGIVRAMPSMASSFISFMRRPGHGGRRRSKDLPLLPHRAADGRRHHSLQPKYLRIVLCDTPITKAMRR